MRVDVIAVTGAKNVDEVKAHLYDGSEVVHSERLPDGTFGVFVTARVPSFQFQANRLVREGGDWGVTTGLFTLGGGKL